MSNDAGPQRSWRLARKARLRVDLLTALLAVLVGALVQGLVAVAATDEAPPEASAAQWAEYQANVAKTIIELQPFRHTQSISIEDALGRRGTAVLTALNPRSNAWFLLTIQWSDTAGVQTYHLENPVPREQTVGLDVGFPYGVTTTRQGRSSRCVLWQGGSRVMSSERPLEQAQRSGLPYAPLCEARLYLRNRVAGTYTTLERITNLLRDHVWGGEKIVRFVRENFYEDAFLEKGVTGKSDLAHALTPPLGPSPASLDPAFVASAVIPAHLGIGVEGNDARGLVLGRWYAARATPGIFVSAMQPSAVSPAILASYRSQVGKLDGVETAALSYFVALDLAELDLKFVLGTDHPRVGWSERILDNMRNPDLPGPDGIDTVAPLVVNGSVPPPDVQTTAAAFAAGFKRQHGAFRYGALANQNSGSHYGFIQQGVVFSKLQPGLATLLVLDDGEVRMQTWRREDDALLARIRYARQNGVALIEGTDAVTGMARPGALVNRWGPGNWSGSSEAQLRTLRSGACLQVSATKRFLIYGYFSSATPSAMARLFQAYGCQYAMLLDMNALEHTYFALYSHRDGNIGVSHLIEGMAEVDRKGGGNQLAPRFLSFPDDRDFFYLTRKEPAP